MTPQLVETEPTTATVTQPVSTKVLLSSSSTVSTSSTTSASSVVDCNTSSSCNNNFQPIVYTEDELQAMRQVRHRLVHDHQVDPTKIGLKILALTTVLNKSRVDDAVQAYLKLLTAVATVGLDQLDEELTVNIKDYLATKHSYQATGVDDQGRQIMWIRNTRCTPTDEEHAWIQSSILGWIAVHADNTTLRQGMMFVVDASHKPSSDQYGNVRKLQSIEQQFPLRPQSILIATSSYAKRLLVNALVQMAAIALGAKAKILKRIQFVTPQQALEQVPLESAPAYLGGGGGGIDNFAEWTEARLQNFTIPNL